MAQAHRAPPAHYNRRLNISRHAIERFRLRVDEEFKARTDDDLANLLDERIRVSKDRREIIDRSYNNTVSQLVGFENRKGETTYAVIRENTCVTVLTPDIVEGNFKSGQWHVPMNTPFAAALENYKPGAPARPPAPAAVRDQHLERQRETLVNSLGGDLARAELDLARATSRHQAAERDCIAAADAKALATRKVQEVREKLTAAVAAATTNKEI